MKKILFALLLLPVIASAQRLQYVNTYGHQYQRVVVDSLFAPPSDTFTVPTALQGYPFIARKGTGLYLWNTSTHVWAAVSGSGSTPTWQDVLTAGSTLTESNTVNGGTNDLFFVNMGEVDIESGISGIRLLSSNNRNSEIRVQQDTISLKPGLGTLIIDTLANIPGTKSMRYNPTTGLVSYADTTTMVYPGVGIPNSTGSAWETSYSTTGSGTVVALATQPTFTTDITTPMVVGGSATGQKITLKTTTGVGSGDSILFKGGNNGATTFASIQASGLNLLDNSYLKMGGSNILHFSTGSNNATFAGAYNFLFNNGGNVFMNSANTTYFSTSTGDLYLSGSGKLGIGTATPDSSLTVTAGIWGKRGVRFSGLPSSHNAADSMMVVNASTGTVGYRPVTPTLQSTYIAYGDGSNLLTGSAGFVWDNSTQTLSDGGSGGLELLATDTKLNLTNNSGNPINISSPNGGGVNIDGGVGGFVDMQVGDDNITMTGSGIAYYDNTSHNGKFGVNTSTLVYNFDVIGTGSISGNFIVGVDGLSGTIFGNPSTHAVGIGDLDGQINGGKFVLSDNDNTAAYYNTANNGLFGINTSTPSVAFHSVGDALITGAVQFSNYGAGAATFDASGNISSVSDVRLKNVQGGYSVGLSALMNIKPIVYKWNEKSKMETEHNYIGFSAQNILSALGQDATGINKDGYLSIQDRAIMATMVVAIQEQQKMIETLQKEIKKLKRK